MRRVSKQKRRSATDRLLDELDALNEQQRQWFKDRKRGELEASRRQWKRKQFEGMRRGWVIACAFHVPWSKVEECFHHLGLLLVERGWDAYLPAIADNYRKLMDENNSGEGAIKYCITKSLQMACAETPPGVIADGLKKVTSVGWLHPDTGWASDADDVWDTLLGYDQMARREQAARENSRLRIA